LFVVLLVLAPSSQELEPPVNPARFISDIAWFTTILLDVAQEPTASSEIDPAQCSPGFACERGRDRRNRPARICSTVALGRSPLLLPLEDKAMSIISKFLALGLSTVLSATVPQHRVDFSMLGPDGQRINQLWLITYINENGVEVVAQAKLQSGAYAPLIATDSERLESMLPAAHYLATSRNMRMRLIELTKRVDIEEIMP